MPLMRRCSHSSLLVSSGGMPRSSLMASRSTGALNLTASASLRVVAIAAPTLTFKMAGLCQRLDDDALEDRPDIEHALPVDENLAHYVAAEIGRAELDQSLQEIAPHVGDALVDARL